MTQYSSHKITDPFIVSLHEIAESSIALVKYSAFSQLQIVSRIASMIFFTCIMFFWIFVLTSTFVIIPLLIRVTSNIHLRSYDICFVNISNSFIPVIILKTLKFKSFVLFGTIWIDQEEYYIITTMRLSRLTAKV